MVQRLHVAGLLIPAVADLVGVPDDLDRQLAGELNGLVGRGVVD
jgi:hypothetical protein